MRLLHNWANEKAAKVVSLSKQRKVTTQKITNCAKLKNCTYPNCFAVVKKLSDHIRRVHKRTIPFYGQTATEDENVAVFVPDNALDNPPANVPADATDHREYASMENLLHAMTVQPVVEPAPLVTGNCLPHNLLKILELYKDWMIGIQGGSVEQITATFYHQPNA